MKFFKWLFFITVFCYAQNLHAQTGIIKGTIANQNGQPLIGANIFTSSGQGASTDVLGNYKFKLDTGKKALTISYIGYESVAFTLTVEANQQYERNFTLNASNVELSDVVITTDEVENIEKITAYDISLRPVKTSQDVLKTIPGLFIAQHAGGGKAEQIFLRGFDIDHGTDIALSVDGMPVNMVSHAHGQGYSDLHFLIPETIEGVSFNKGPYYAEQGNFNTAGYAAFNTKNHLDKSSVKLEAGQFNSYRAVAMVDILGDKNKNHDFYIASEVNLTDGYFESDQDFSRLNFFGKYTGRVNQSNLLKASVSTFTSTWDASGQIPIRAVNSGQITRFGAIDDTEGGETSRTNVNINHTSILGDNKTFSQQLYFSNYNFKLYSNFTFFLNDSINGDQITQREARNLYGYQASYIVENNKLTTEIGGGFRYDDVNDIRLSRTRDREVILSDLAYGDVDEINFNGYVSETLNFNANLSLNAALRYDYFVFKYNDALTTDDQRTVNKGTLSPKMKLNYKIKPDVNLFVKGGIGFHSNDSRVVVAKEGQDILPKAYGFDIGGIFKPIKNMVVTTALWYLDLDQEFVYVGDEGIVEPSGKTRRKGLDVSVRYQALPWLYLDADFNVTDPKSLESNEGDDYIPLAPTLTTVGGVNVKLKNGINGSLRYRYLADRPANESNTTVAEGYLLIDAVLNYTQPKYEIGISVENVLDTAWKEAQFETESRLRNETASVTELHFTPGTPLFFKASLSYFF